MTDDTQAKTTVTRLGTPSAFILLIGLGLVYYALRGWDIKYNTFNGTFGGKTASPALPTGVAAPNIIDPALRSQDFGVRA